MKPIPNLIPRFNLDYNFGDFLYSLKSIFFTDDIDLKSLNLIFGNKNFFFTNSGRTSLYAILRALNLQKNSKIGVPLYSCTVVFDAIIKAGHIPRFIDIDLDNYTMDPNDLADKINDLSAIVVIHTFGRPADMDKIGKIAGNIPIIEDCAHSLLSEYKGKKTGTIGVASFFSLAKYISAGGGGMVLLNNTELVDDVQREMDVLEMISPINEIRHSFMVYIKSFLYHVPWFGLFALPIGLAVESKVDLMDKKGFEVSRIRRGDLGSFLKKLEIFKEKMELQREKSFFLIDALRETSFKLPHEGKNTYCNYYLFPVLFTSRKERDLASVFLRNIGIDTAKLFSETPLKAKEQYGYNSDCPNSEKLADIILTIPNYYTISEIELIKVADNIKKVERLL